jgi:hypothetical protein
MGKMKRIEVEGRQFSIRKFDAKSSVKISKLLIAKILPVFDKVMPLLSQGLDAGSLSGAMDASVIAGALDLIRDEDLDKIFDTSLKHCYEDLPAGQAQVMGANGLYGVADLEDDPLLALRLVAEAVMWSVEGFFDASRLGSVLSPLFGMLRQKALT